MIDGHEALCSKADMSMPVFPNDAPHPLGRDVLRTDPPLPWTDCYHPTLARTPIHVRVTALDERERGFYSVWPMDDMIKLNLATRRDRRRQDELLEECEKKTSTGELVCHDLEEQFLFEQEDDVRDAVDVPAKCDECDEENCAHFYYPEGQNAPSEPESDGHSLNSDTRSRCTADTDGTEASCFDDWVFESPVVNVWFDLTSLSADEIPSPWTFWDEMDELKR